MESGIPADGDSQVLEGYWGIPEPQDQAQHESGLHYFHQGGEEEAYLLFVHSKEGLHWGIGAASRKKSNTELAPYTQGCLSSR